ncbi:septal ring lytic transglycosylase RlpA family protein [Sansalvadorimonas sp. 2012CJ34-2]|uniref:Endolytic peptidoglycan transglycosylase RlpA n=1 Tax=Parendozoicomonas callyspongiae TaxID=2942213 RepID=A0ABT0PDM0_9GAMM|nr:septal ring lytic transglycosylase RlpA family protein [Sansalvadorimonas sp. 2012CJ34-2]MCL6269126.1 septal ring lytic transglycosylase RlpA family protein [Sansalvadorimonas sp. 2012CJ34-2]
MMRIINRLAELFLHSPAYSLVNSSLYGRLISKEAVFFLTVAFLAGCASTQTQEEIQASRYKLKHDSSHKNIDVSQIPDAVPQVAEGDVKFTPYSLNGISYVPLSSATGYRKEGVASWYGVKFHGYKTANGEIYDMYGMTAAHKTLPLPSYVKVTNLANNRSVIVRVNDRGPFHGNRVIDLSWAAAKKLGYHNRGTARVRIEGIDTSPEGLLAFQATSAGTKATPAPVRKTTSAVDRTVSEASSEGEQLYLQVAALSSRDGATALKRKLLNVTSVPVRVISGADSLFRVRVGPFRSEQDLQRLQDALGNASMAKGHRVYE